MTLGKRADGNPVYTPHWYWFGVHLRKSSRRQGYPRISCNLETLHIWNHEGAVDKDLWHGERLYWSRIWAWFGIYNVCNLEISCRNKEDVKSQNTRKGWYSIQYVRVQFQPGSEFWRVVVTYRWDCPWIQWGDGGGMAQIKTPSSQRTMTAVSAAITYQRMSQKLVSTLWKKWNALWGDSRNYHCGEWLRNLLNDSLLVDNSRPWKRSHRPNDRSHTRPLFQVIGRSP